MKEIVDTTIEQLMKTRRFAQLSEAELELINEYYSEKEYEEYFALFQAIDTSLNASAVELEIPPKVKTAIFNSFHTKKEKKKVITLKTPILKIGLGLAAAAILLITITLNFLEKKSPLALTNEEFNAYTQQEDFGINENVLDEVSTTLQNTDFSSSIIEGSVPNCNW